MIYKVEVNKPLSVDTSEGMRKDIMLFWKYKRAFECFNVCSYNTRPPYLMYLKKLTITGYKTVISERAAR